MFVSSCSRPRRAQQTGITSALLAAGVLLAGVAHVDAKEPPRLRPGLWQFDRTLEVNGTQTDRRLTSNLLIKPQEKRCVDPNGAFMAASRPIFLGTCRVTRSQPSDNEYVTMTYCGGGEPVKSVMTIESDSAYKEV